LTLRAKRCSTLADPQALLPDYAPDVSKKLDANAVRALVERAKELTSGGSRLDDGGLVRAIVLGFSPANGGAF
jgi:hypothetical protein